MCVCAPNSGPRGEGDLPPRQRCCSSVKCGRRSSKKNPNQTCIIMSKPEQRDLGSARKPARSQSNLWEAPSGVEAGA